MNPFAPVLVSKATVISDWLQSHTLCRQLQAEIHARPFPRLEAPTRASFLAVFAGEDGREAEFMHLAELARLCEAKVPTTGESALSFADFECGGLRVRWERHTEFYTYTFLRSGDFEAPFAETALDLVPQEWLAGISGEVIVAAHLALQSRQMSEPGLDELHHWFEQQRLIASEVVEGNARLWTSMSQMSDGFCRFYIHDNSLTDCRAGRLVQRLLEQETYRSLALLSLPLAREMGPTLSDYERRIGQLMCDIVAVGDLNSERQLLKQITELAVAVEKMRARVSYRFNATEAYFQIMTRRLFELREEQMVGFQTVEEFLERRVPPAVRTCQAVNNRAESLSHRLDRAAELLRTRIELTLEAQNQEILASMEHRADLQLRLQETVEGLSLAAVSYYLLQLVKYGAGAAEAWGVPISHRWVDALALPIAMGIAWWSVQRAKHHLRTAVAGAGTLKGNKPDTENIQRPASTKSH